MASFIFGDLKAGVLYVWVDHDRLLKTEELIGKMELSLATILLTCFYCHASFIASKI